MWVRYRESSSLSCNRRGGLPGGGPREGHWCGGGHL